MTLCDSLLVSNTFKDTEMTFHYQKTDNLCLIYNCSKDI